MKPIEVPVKAVEWYFRWTAQRNGGLFLGVRFIFPMRVIYLDGLARDTVSLHLGLLVCVVSVDFRYNPSKESYV